MLLLGEIIVIITEVGSLTMINLAMWKFGFHYYNCGRKLPYYIVGTQPPSSLNKCNNIIQKVFTILNCVSPIAFGAISFIQFQQIRNTGTVNQPWMLLPPYFAIGLLEVISFLFLGAGMWFMRKAMNEYGIVNELNGSMAVLHLICVLMYLSVGILVYYNIYDIIQDGKENKKYMVLCVFDQLMQSIA
jgi:hypothetical protein